VKTLFYCQHSVGIGHLVRTLRLAEASLANGPVLLICGGAIPQRLQINPKIQVLSLPPLRMLEDNTLVDAKGDGDVDNIFQTRARLAACRIREFLPDAVVIEMFPFGRKKFAREVLAIIKTAREQGKTRVFSSVRDVLVTKRHDQDRHDLRAVAWLNENFDAVLIHSDKKIVALDATFSTFDKIGIPVYYTGYISNECQPPESERCRQIVVSAGGGRVGHELVKAAMAAFPRINADLDLDMLIVTGPNGGGLKSPANGQKSPTTVAFINNLPDVFARSMVSVSQCGYNTAVDLLRTRTPAIFVPYETASEDEQPRRAQLLATQGCALMLRQKSLTASAIVDAASKLLSSNYVNTPDIDLNGAQRSSALIRAVSRCA